MEQWKSVEDILDFAIEQEEEAAAFYTELATNAKKAWMKTVFVQFAKEEIGHKNKLLYVKKGGVLKPTEGKVMDLKIGDYLVDVEANPNMEYQDALIVAMKKEKAAFRLYSDIAAQAEDEALRDTFLALAQEEAKHKLRFEVEYDENILTEN